MSEIDLKNISVLKCVTDNDMNKLRIICDLAQHGKFNLEEIDKYGNTALLKGCYLGRYEAVETLLECGANVKAQNCYGQNALTLATFSGHFCIVRKLLRYRSYADFNTISITPALCIATLCGHKRLIEYFQNLKKSEEAQAHETTIHGLSPRDIEEMLRAEKPKEKKYQHIYL